MNTADKDAVIDLVNQMPETATFSDLAREVESLARLRGGCAEAPVSSWLIGQGCREELHRVSRERAERLVERLLPLFGHGGN